MTPPTRPPRMRPKVTVLVVILLLIPCIGLAVVPAYSSETPMLWGWPFFYWYQVLWIIITPILTCAAYLVIKRERSGR